ncbi:hypothetical protein ACTWPB_22870 [Nocardia sp. IBHARD005]|uniref:hypothetical protein n=1 Tax=Nocardia sp. IBHARD005 TaxID=3457765 RepID=UPI004059525B
MAGAGAAQGLDVVQAVIGVLRTGQSLELRDPDVHLLGRLGVGGVEELEFDTGDFPTGTGLGDEVGRRDVGHLRSLCRGDTDTARDETLWAGRQHRSERVETAACHRISGDHVLADAYLSNCSPGAMIGWVAARLISVVASLTCFGFWHMGGRSCRGQTVVVSTIHRAAYAYIARCG